MQTSMLRKSFAGQQVAAAPVQVGILLVRSCRCVLASIPHCRPWASLGQLFTCPVMHPSFGSDGGHNGEGALADILRTAARFRLDDDLLRAVRPSAVTIVALIQSEGCCGAHAVAVDSSQA